MAGILYGIGVGPGDPELMTVRAVKRLAACQVVAVPHTDRDRCSAYQIAVQAVPQIAGKECLCLHMPMTKDKQVMEESHVQAARAVEDCLDRGLDVAFITLGDVGIYSTPSYVMERVAADGYATAMECGIPSFCAAAARLGEALVKGEEELHIIPAASEVDEALRLPGVKVIMKAGKQMARVKEELRAGGCRAVMVENCGMKDERVYEELEEIPDGAGYYSLLIVK